MKRGSIVPQFVEFIPDKLEEGILYISEKHGTVIHKCCCGCGEEVVTPLTPADWQLRRFGATVSMIPSIGNWNFRCQSHYWIRKNRIEWASALTKKQIRHVQEKDRRDKEFYVAQVNARNAAEARDSTATDRLGVDTKTASWLSGVSRWLKDLLRR